MVRRLLAIACFVASLSPAAGAAAAGDVGGGRAPSRREVCGTKGVLNLRTAPSMGARVIGRLPDEYALVVVGTSGSGTWLEVRDEGGRTGWVARRFTCADDGEDDVPRAWKNPAPGACVTSPFGPRQRPCRVCSRHHRGIDLGICGEPVRAAAAGMVIAARWERRGGNVVVVNHGGGFVSYYLHLKSRSVRPGDRVAAGSRIGIAGRTGTATTGCHLHFEVRRNGRAIDPQSLFPGGRLTSG